MTALATWAIGSDEEAESLIARFHHGHANVLLLGAEPVCVALSEVIQMLDQIGSDLSHIRRLDPSQGLAAAQWEYTVSRAHRR